MANRSDVDYDKQFKDDLEKATALSLETLALEQFKRTKINYSASERSSLPNRVANNSVKLNNQATNYITKSNLQRYLSHQNAGKSMATPLQSRSRPGSFNSGRQEADQSSANLLLPPDTNNTPSRRHSEIRLPTKEEDLISFTATSPNVPKVEQQGNFNKLLKEIERLNTEQTLAVQPHGFYQQQSTYGYGSTPSLAGIGAASLTSNTGGQLMPYNPQAAKTPLTAEELKKLYSMPQQISYIQNVQYPPAATSVPIGPYANSTPGYGGYQTNSYSNLQYSNNSERAMVQVSVNQVKVSQIQKSASMSGVASIAENRSPSASISGVSSNYNSNPISGNSSIKSDINKRGKTTLGDNLIDLNQDDDDSRVSVLEAFDPLLCDESFDENDASSCATSYYAEYDPFDYLYSCSTQYSDPVYEAVNKSDRTPISPSASIGWRPEYCLPSVDFTNEEKQITPPPLPPRNSIGSLSTTPPSVPQKTKNSNELLDRRKASFYSTKLYEVITDRKSVEPELMAFYRMVKEIRLHYKYDDVQTNVGHVIAREFENKYSEEKSIKLLVHPALNTLKENSERVENGQIEGYGAPVVFTCDIKTTVELVIETVYYALEGQTTGSVDDFVCKSIGIQEWLRPASKLCQLECVHDSIKLEQDVQLGFCRKLNENMQVIARAEKDDRTDASIKPEDILPNETAITITYDHMMILIETLETEIDKLESGAQDSNAHLFLSCSGVVQGVKAICALLGSVDSLELCEYVDDLKRICQSNPTTNSPNIVSEYGDYAQIMLRPKTVVDSIKLKCNQIREEIQELIETYTNAFRVDFCIKSLEYVTTPLFVSDVLKPIVVKISCLHRPPPNWKYEDYSLGVQIYHGTRTFGETMTTYCSSDLSGGLFPRLKFNSWLSFEKSPICTLPRESRLVFVLYGTEPATENDQKNDDNQENKRKNLVEIGWCAIQIFDFNRQMICGNYLLSLWPATKDRLLGPAPSKGSHPQPDFCPVLSIEIPTYGGTVLFNDGANLDNVKQCPRYDFNSLDMNLQQELLDTAEQGYPGQLDKREVFWEKRHYLQDFPHALPKVLHAAHSWDYASLMDLHSLLKSWDPLTPLQALELLLPQYPDLEVRTKAVEWISKMPNDQLVDFLPQLLQALKHDTYEASPMASFLLSKSLESPRIAHHLYWLLVHSLPGDSPENSIDSSTTASEIEDSLITQARYHRRNKMMLRALLAICGEKLSSRFLSQKWMCKTLAEVAQTVKLSKESMRQKSLVVGLGAIHQALSDNATSLPLGPGQEVAGIQIRNCSYFNSNTLPLKIAFNGPDNSILPAIFKAGDDLQQDMLTIQLVRIMDKLWLAEGLDLKMVTFNCVPTGYKRGMIEMVSDAETLRKIQVEYGLTGSFKDRPIAEWLQKQNPSQLEYQRAVDNFTVSCAGYSVATYILGICDRHNDNIMLKTSGHLFHIDFGKFLGDSQMFGNFKRDRTPFVLTSDMAYVINCGEKPSTKFHHFVDLCCRAFNIVRKHGDLILHMLALMATANIPGVTADAVQYVRRALLPSQSNPEAAASFAKMIQFSLKSWFTQFNFFLHNLAQLRFSSDDCGGELLSFVPKKYTLQMDGRLKSVMVHGYQKRYDSEKYYTYILRLTRHNQPDPAYLFRSYKEFLEFHQKLCLHFPLAKLHSLPSGIHVGRSNIKNVAERRLPEIRYFLISLFNSSDEIAHSDLVYTFFHPLLRDQKETNINLSKVKEDIKPLPEVNSNVCGELKLSLQYRRGTLTVMIHHARNLPILPGSQEPNTYVKCYLKPDPTKITKRKTKITKRSCFPSFMETLEYRMPLELIQHRILQVTVWSHDTLQENELLGGFDIALSTTDLRDELIDWFRLGHVPRR